MKNTFVCLSALIIYLANSFYAQVNQDDFNRIKLAPVILPQASSIPTEAHSFLVDKMNQIVSNNGMTSNPGGSRFIITPNVAIVSKEITGGSPILFTYNLQVTFYIGDGINGTKFSSASLSCIGVGASETKAYMDAFKRIKVTDEKLIAALNQGKQKIIDYYTKNCDLIINAAMAKSNQFKFDEAIYDLMSIPDVCKECYNKGLEKVAQVYQAKINFECKRLINEANNIWSANPNYDGAQQAAALLSRILPGSSCYNDAALLSDKIAKRVKELDQREWNFMLKQQQDSVDIEKEYIRAARDIGVAYGENQPDVIYETTLILWW